MYLQYFGLERSPFTRKPGPDVFFAQAGRKDILKNLRDNLQQGETAMLLTGPQGAGKTIICRLIQHRLDGSSYKVISLEDPAGSFDDLLTKVCLKLGMPSDGDAEQDITSVLRRLIRQQNEQGRSVLLLIDEAEKMFLAALERLFRLLNELHETFGTQALLVGRPALSTSIEQLSGYCEDVRIGSAYSLADFSAEETSVYLNFRLSAAGDGRGAADSVFSEGAVQEIFRLGQGLPGLIDGIAESSLEKAAAAGEQTVLPAHVVAPDDTAPRPLAEDEEERKGHKGLLLFLLVLCLIA
ncbi:MAG: AAA family ATPase, partial [Candidatus Electrothrix sp. AUS4]|nr:AAA family ATPase [Candidatus Electrothrix sp. AUS4]